MTSAAAIPTSISDPVNASILGIAEDRLVGFLPDPLGEIAQRSGLPVATVIERIGAMLSAGTIRRVRQTLLATNLAHGALVAWEVSLEKVDEAFDYLFKDDPFSGHVVIRTTDTITTGSSYRLWTTLKVPQGYSLEKHCKFLQARIGATHFRIMPAKILFTLGVGHVRRRGLEPGARSDVPGQPQETAIVTLSDEEWLVLGALKREFTIDELSTNIFEQRAKEIGVPIERFYEIARDLDRRRVIGRFSTFLEHVKATGGNERVTRYNALFHWAVPEGREFDAGREVARHYVITHAYWREGGPEFKNVNVMAVAHGTEKQTVLAHKAAIDEHLAEAGIAPSYTNVFWGGRSEIKPSEILPAEYRAFCTRNGLDPEAMREVLSEEPS